MFVFATIKAFNCRLTEPNQMRTIEDIRARRIAELHELEQKLEKAKHIQSKGTMSWRRDGISSPPIDTKNYLVGHYQRLIHEQRSILKHLYDR